MTLWFTILGCTSFFFPQKMCFSRPYYRTKSHFHKYIFFTILRNSWRNTVIVTLISFLWSGCYDEFFSFFDILDLCPTKCNFLSLDSYPEKKNHYYYYFAYNIWFDWMGLDQIVLTKHHLSLTVCPSITTFAHTVHTR